MNITKDTVVTLKQRVADRAGAVVDEGDVPIRYLHGGYNAIFPKLEAAVDGKGVGDTVEVTLEPEDRLAGRAFAQVRAAAADKAEAAALAEAEAAGLVEIVYVAQLGTHFRLVFRSQTHKLCWIAPIFLLPFLVIVLTALRVRPVLDKAPAPP